MLRSGLSNLWMQPLRARGCPPSFRIGGGSRGNQPPGYEKRSVPSVHKARRFVAQSCAEAWASSGRVIWFCPYFDASFLNS